MHPTVAPLAQVLTGHPVGPESGAFCMDCKAPIEEGELATAYAYRPAGETRWEFGSLCCAECDRRVVRHPTVGTAEAIVEGWIGTRADAGDQSIRPVLLDLDVLHHSGPREGNPP